MYQWKRRLGGIRTASADQDNGISPRYRNKEAGGSSIRGESVLKTAAVEINRNKEDKIV
jgi:hypothetical protein